MALENTLDDIFTDYDESILSDGSIDPMGLRIIWTSIGNKIFHNRLNTISTDIRYYTLNLFHHYLLQKCLIEESDNVTKIIGKPPYNNKSDLIEGIIIFLENLLIHATYEHEDTSLMVPGKNKLGNSIKDAKKKQSVEKLIVNRDKGILVRQYLLGIHGRHKGPFQQMEIFSTSMDEPYSNADIWIEAESLFTQSPWKETDKVLTKIIKEKILTSSQKKNHIEYSVKEILTINVKNKYTALLNKEIYYNESIKNFWLNRLGLNRDTAKILYDQYKKTKEPDSSYQTILIEAHKSAPQDQLLAAINAIEPFLTLIDKCIRRLLGSGTVSIDKDLELFVENWLNYKQIDISEIRKYCTPEFLNQEAQSRLDKLLKIYITSIHSNNRSETFITELIKYHQQIMNARGNLNWISIGVNNKISVHRSTYISDSYLQELKSKKWVNTYYLPTVHFLHNGLNHETTK